MRMRLGCLIGHHSWLIGRPLQDISISDRYVTNTGCLFPQKIHEGNEYHEEQLGVGCCGIIEPPGTVDGADVVIPADTSPPSI